MSLTLTRIFGDPDLNGAAPMQLKIGPAGKHISYLKADEKNFEQLNLWSYDRESAEHALLVDASEFSQDRILSDAEKARRERLRISHQGIVEYYWSPTGESLLFPIEGNLFLYSLNAAQPLTQLTDQSTFETDIRFSPDAKKIAFVREQNLFVMDLDTRETTQLTNDGGGLVTCGLADFIAQEEMHRYTGYWWSPDSKKIAFARVDEAPIEVSQRYEIDADNFGVFDQRYPYAGEKNADVKLGVVELSSGEHSWVDLDQKSDDYITRVNWFRDSIHLAVQVQTRLQQSLTLQKYDTQSKSLVTLVEESSESWLNLNDNFTALADNHFLWGSERSGFNHLYHFDANGNLIAQLTTGDWVVADVKAVSEDHIYFDGFKDTPLERHLYRVALENQSIERLTELGFSHHTTLSADASVFVDRFSSALTPPAVKLMSQSGELIESLEPNALDEQHPYAPYLNLRGQHEFATVLADDGQTLHYRLIKPASNKLEVNGAAPLLLTVYGGPGVQRVSNEWIPPWNHYMAQSGYALLQLDNRGTTNRGVKFESPIYRQLGKIEVEDQLKGLDAVLGEATLDSNRVGVFGHSYGGYMTLMLMMKSDRFKAGICVAPVTDWQLYDTHYTERFMAMPQENIAGYEQSAVFPWVKSLSGKLLLIHGMADDNVLFSNSTKLYKALQDENIDFDIMNYPGAKHGLTGRSVNLHRYSLMDRFLQQNLIGKTS